MKHNLTLGVLLSLLGAFLYSSQTALVKAQAFYLPPLPMLIFFQSIISLCLTLPIIFKNGSSGAKKLLTTQKIELHLLRTIFSLLISYLLFYAVLFIPLTNGMLLANSAPLIMPILAYLFLSQKINHKLWAPILIAYSGVAIVMQPDASLLNPASLLAFGAAVSLAATMLTIRKLSETEATETITFYFFLFSSIISGIIAIKFWVPMTSKVFLILIAIGALYFATQYIITAALKYANPQLVGSLIYSNIIYAAAISQFVWNTLPSNSTLLGMLLITIGGLLCIHAEHTTNLQVNKLTLEES